MSRNDYNISGNNGVGLISSALLQREGVNHGFTLRNGGVSVGDILGSLNFGFNRPEPRKNVIENYHRLCDAYGLEFESLVMVNYVHGGNVVAVDSSDRGRGISNEVEPLPPCDGIVTRDKSVTLITLHADCAAIFFFDKVTGAVGLCHAGWKGAFERIGAGIVCAMHDNYGSDPKNIVAAVSPCICKDCLEVDRVLAMDFAQRFGDARVYSDSRLAEKAYLDLPYVCKIQLLDSGLLEKNIAVIPVCTFENENMLYSYRRDHKGTGAMAAFITTKLFR